MPAWPDTSSADALQRWLTHRTFWFVAGVVAVVLLPFTAVWIAKQAWVIAAATGGGLLAIGWCAWQVHRNPLAHVERYTWSILVVEFLAMAANSWLQGGSDAPALRWQAIIPCIAIAAGAYRTGLVMTLVFVLQVLVMHQYQPDYIAAWRHHVLPSPDNQRLFAVVIPVCLFAFFGLFTTLWRRRVLEALELSRQQARQGEEAKERFLATMSHEIRTPLNGVIGTLSLLQSAQLAPAQQREMHELALRSSRSLMGLLNDVLDWSKLSAGRIEVALQPVNLQAMVRDAIDLFSAVAVGKGIGLNMSVDAAVPAAVLSDEVRLRQIVHNLLANAIKFTDQGKVSVSVRALGPIQDGVQRLMLSVQDSGIGMSPDQVARLFRPFVQGDQTITRQYGGTGLGLAICHELAQLLGADITVDSAEGSGSTFNLTWSAPVVTPAVPPSTTSQDVPVEAQQGAMDIAAVSAVVSAPPHALRALIADDNPTNVLILREMLALQGVVCYSVDAGADALRQCAQQRPDLLFLDYQMPGMDGLTVVQHLRQEEAQQGLPRLPIILVSGDVLLRSEQDWRRAGVDHVLSKPIDYVALTDLVARYQAQAGAAPE